MVRPNNTDAVSSAHAINPAERAIYHGIDLIPPSFEAIPQTGLGMD
jgi:hypothetical protein